MVDAFIIVVRAHRMRLMKQQKLFKTAGYLHYACLALLWVLPPFQSLRAP